MSGWGGRREGAGSSYSPQIASGWLTTSEAAQMFDRSPSWLRDLLDDPEHAEFAAKVRRRGSHRQFPARITWFYACEGRLPVDWDELDEFLEHWPPPVIRRRNVAQLVDEPDEPGAD